MNLTIEQKQKVYEHLLTLDCPDLLAALIAERSNWHPQDNGTNSISYEILHRFDWMRAPEGYNFWVDMYDDIYAREIETVESIVKPEPPVIKPITPHTNWLMIEFVAIILVIIMICTLAFLYD
jgi:hypothetical protein